ncbi:MAG: transcription antitermination factor NusB [Gallionella sp.]|nr:transcription antitermination factor NusB [Gallionella sp.]MDP1593185.1 transcription antitermination factor NusB [Gallionella sp.]
MSMPAETVAAKSPPQKSPRHRARELALQGVYQWRVSGSEAADIEKHMHAEKNLGRYDKPMFSRLLRGAIAQHDALEALLTPHLDRPLDELSTVELAVLLVAAFELSQQPDVPYKVVINEAVELAKTFGGTDGHKYVNGVLDKLAPQVRAVEFAHNRK